MLKYNNDYDIISVITNIHTKVALVYNTNLNYMGLTYQANK